MDVYAKSSTWAVGILCSRCPVPETRTTWRAGHGPYLVRSLYILALLSVKWASLVFNTFDIIYRDISSKIIKWVTLNGVPEPTL